MDELSRHEILYVIQCLYAYWEEFGSKPNELAVILDRLINKYDLVYDRDIYNYRYKEEKDHDR